MDNNFCGKADLSSPDNTQRALTPPALMASAAVFGVLFSCLFVRQDIGLNMLVFVLMIYGFAVFNRSLFIRKTFREEWMAYLACIPVIFLSAFVFIGSTFLNALGILLILFVLFVQYLVLSGNALYRWDQPGFLLDILFGALNRGLFGVGHFVTGSVNRIFKKQSPGKKGAVIGIVAGILLLMLIIPMLMLADSEFSSTLNALFKDIDIGDAFLYLLFFLIGASLITAPVATAGMAESTGSRQKKQGAARRPGRGDHDGRGAGDDQRCVHHVCGHPVPVLL